MSLENQMVVNDVVETYIPIIINDRSVGTFELYYNITSRKESLDKLISRYNYLLYALSFMIIVAAWFTLFLFYKNIKERQKYEGNLFEMAKKDKLTNVYNRRMFVELLQLQIEQYNRDKSNNCVILLDIDLLEFRVSGG